MPKKDGDLTKNKILAVAEEMFSEKGFDGTSVEQIARTAGINKALIDQLKKPITIMHPGPINRGVELNSDVADSDAAIILHQVENGVAIRMAVLYLLASNKTPLN